LLVFQENEITEHHIYRRLAKRVKSPQNSHVLTKIAAEERRHYDDWRRYSGEEVKPNRWKIWKYDLISRLLGFTFAAKLMERGEETAQENYGALIEAIPEAERIMQEENEHEEALLDILDEERLRYTSSIVLGLNDALVELTGALAGFTLALQDTALIALTGLITGIAAALSMGASEYLATKSGEDAGKHPVRASLYTGGAYIITVFLLILPYLLLNNYYLCLACTLAIAVVVIAFFNYYMSVATDIQFKERFLEMAGVSLGVTGLSFVIGFLVRIFLGVDV
ncbi:MAG: VIT1/CCC1 transporter family protein, partial [Anaerolineales bacterium]